MGEEFGEISGGEEDEKRGFGAMGLLQDVVCGRQEYREEQTEREKQHLLLLSPPFLSESLQKPKPAAASCVRVCG